MTSIATSPREKALAKISELPPFSPILTKLMATLNDDSVSFAQLGDLIERDPVLTGNVLRIVNSAFHARRGTVTSARHAVSLLGTVKIRNITMSLSVARMWNEHRWAAGWSPARFNLHSVAIGVLADLTAAETEVDFAEGAFTAGLLRNNGVLLIAMGLSGELARVRDLHVASGLPLMECEREILGFDHAGLTADMLEQWRLPARLIDAARPEAAKPGSLGALLNSCQLAVDRRGVCMQEWIRPPEGEPAEALTGLLGDGAEPVLEAFDREFDALRAFFQ